MFIVWVNKDLNNFSYWVLRNSGAGRLFTWPTYAKPNSISNYWFFIFNIFISNIRPVSYV